MIEYTPTFTIGYNTPGYMPEMDVYVVHGVEDARQAMWDELDRHSDHIEMGDPKADETLGLLGEIDQAKTDVKTADITTGWGYTVVDPERQFDLGTHYWITPGGVIEEDE